MKKRSIKPGTLLAPVPAVMASLGTMESPNIITIGWTGIVNSEPPMTYISVRKSRYSHDIIEQTGEFVINLTSKDLAFACDWAGVKSGRDFDKFKELNLTAVPCEKLSCPMIGESPINLECKVIEKHKYPSHDMFVAEIVAVHINEELFDEEGRIMFERAGLVAYIHGEYLGVEKKSIGRMGYSVMKPKTRKRKNREEHAKRVEKNRQNRQSRQGTKNTSKKLNKKSALKSSK